jgi:diguanylate cyclase (GGDEF)-like protein
MNLFGRARAGNAPLAVFTASVAMVVAIGYLDYRSEVYLSFALFYLVPIGVSVRYAGRNWGLAVALLSAVAGLVGDVAAPGAYGLLPIWNAATRLGVFVVAVMVLTRLRQAHETEHRLARTDVLTGVANFRWLSEEVQREMYASRRYGAALSLAYLDLDDFKRVNDECGHAAGDEVLRTVAAALLRLLRPTDLVARIGGDEFVVLLPHTDAKGAQRAMERVAEDLAAPETGPPIRFSSGVIDLDRAVGSIDDLIGRADERMYEAKRAAKAARATDLTRPATTLV